jgi:hypothetical protein
MTFVASSIRPSPALAASTWPSTMPARRANLVPS